jgi:hypothetical protein
MPIRGSLLHGGLDARLYNTFSLDMSSIYPRSCHTPSVTLQQALHRLLFSFSTIAVFSRLPAISLACSSNRRLSSAGLDCPCLPPFAQQQAFAYNVIALRSEDESFVQHYELKYSFSIPPTMVLDSLPYAIERHIATVHFPGRKSSRTPTCRPSVVRYLHPDGGE